MSLSTTARTWVVGEIVTASELNTEIRNAINGLQAAWDSWSITVVSGLTIGAGGVLAGASKQVGKDIKARWTFTFGTGSAVSAVILQLPVAIQAAYALNYNIGGGNVLDSSVGSSTRTPLAMIVNNTTAGGFGSFFPGSISGQINATTPFTWATGDIMSGTLDYEAA